MEGDRPGNVGEGPTVNSMNAQLRSLLYPVGSEPPLAHSFGSRDGEAAIRRGGRITLPRSPVGCRE